MAGQVSAAALTHQACQGPARPNALPRPYHALNFFHAGNNRHDHCQQSCQHIFYIFLFFPEQGLYKNALTAVYICANLCLENRCFFSLPGMNARRFPGSFLRDELGGESGRFR